MEGLLKFIGGLAGCALYIFWAVVFIGIAFWVCGYGGIIF